MINNEPDDYDFDDIDVEKITHLYQLRHAYNVLGYRVVADGLKIPTDRVVRLYKSKANGSLELSQIIKLDDEKFKEFLAEKQREENERLRIINDVKYKNERLVNDLKKKRTGFAGIGTNKAKRRLNKLSITIPVAKAVRLALEIEDKSISAKNSYGKYQEKIYNQKTKIILDLCKLFKEQAWVYGVQESEVAPTSHVIYFEIPGCEQISWHFSPDKISEFPKYLAEWDKKINSTLRKLEAITIKILDTEKMASNKLNMVSQSLT